MTLREEMVAKVAALKAEVAELEAHLASGGTWLEQEAHTVEAWVKALIARVRGVPPAPPAA